ncbi:MAG: threonine aldolase family protein, partial [Candidatus Adiutrix sp.]
HIAHNEGGGAARLSGVSTAAVCGFEVTAKDVENLFRPKGNPHYPRTTLVCLENALANGQVVPIERMKATYEVAHERGLTVHLDGARLFHAAAALNVSADKITAWADTVMFCLSKGLASPVGSMVCGSQSFINEVRHCRTVLGGGLRQAGVLAACGLISLEKMTKRLVSDHENAKYLAQLLREIPEVEVLGTPEINMVFWRPQLADFNEGHWLDFMSKNQVKVNGQMGGIYRLVTHLNVTKTEIETFGELFREYFSRTSR